jgi:hypothetical protein
VNGPRIALLIVVLIAVQVVELVVMGGRRQGPTALMVLLTGWVTYPLRILPIDVRACPGMR